MGRESKHEFNEDLAWVEEADSKTLGSSIMFTARKYDHPMAPTDDGRVGDADGNAGRVFLVTPDVVFGWGAGLTSPTRWRFRHH